MIPLVLKILNKEKTSATEDSVYGIVKAIESYITNFMLKNNSNLPNETLEYECKETVFKLINDLEYIIYLN